MNEEITKKFKKNLIDYIYNLQQENQQLKEQLEKKYEKVGTLTNEILYEENTKLLSVLDEIREYIKREASHYAYEDDYDFYLCEEQIEDLLQILNKVNSEHNSENV